MRFWVWMFPFSRTIFKCFFCFLFWIFMSREKRFHKARCQVKKSHFWGEKNAIFEVKKKILRWKKQHFERKNSWKQIRTLPKCASTKAQNREMLLTFFCLFQWNYLTQYPDWCLKQLNNIFKEFFNMLIIYLIELYWSSLLSNLRLLSS
jgi:hypothetical protein